jgi:hypothetical protein
MSPADLATLSLLDPDQGVCPNGHRCALARIVGRRICAICGFIGIALVCWEITSEHIDEAERVGADPVVVDNGRAFLADQGR